MKQPHRHGPMAYCVELWAMRLRDLIRPPAGILSSAGGLREGMTVLDFGCGPGGFSVASARIVGPAGRVYAHDARRQALDAVRRAAARVRLGNITLVEAGGLQGVPAQSVDVALLYDVLHGCPKSEWREQILVGIHRVLKGEGWLSVRDHHIDHAALSAEIAGSRLFRLAAKQGDALRFVKICVSCEHDGG